MFEGGAVPCLSPVVTDFPEISRKFEGLRLELVSRNFVVVAEQNLVSSHPRLRGHGNGPRRAALCDRDPRMRKSSSTPAGGWRAYILVLLKGLLMYLKLDSSNYPHRRAGLVGRRVGGGGGAHYLLGFTVCLRVICEL